MSTLITNTIQDVSTIKRSSSVTAATIDSNGYVDTTKESVFHVNLGSNQNIPNQTATIINFDTVLFDPNSWWDNSNKRFVPTVAGYYCVMASARWNTGADFDIADFSIYKNGSLYQAASLRNERYETHVITTVMNINGSGDYFDARMYQDTGSTYAIRGQASETTLQGFRILG